MHSACGLLDADLRTPSLDYTDLINASRQLCNEPGAGRLQYRRAVFNLHAANQDDHSKNRSFLQDNAGSWQVAPFYDVTFNPHPFNKHTTAFGGYGKQPPLTRIIHGVARISRRDLFSQWIFFSRRILTDICKRKNSLWNQRSSEIRSIP
ncbi:hypothetical protein AB833_11070 [Chromatiales bacterium (ex Bugula neritina AB1)]|nr:hypothetical protein AB833_11070 [Chromatiales bacterium (ex Bugula neritina AB1)]